MNLAQLRERIALANSWLLAAVFFCIPVQVAPAYVLSAAMLALWTIEGRFGERLRELAREPLVQVVLGYYGVLLLSMLWTDDSGWGWQMLQRHKFFLLFPLYFSVARPEHFGRYVAAFLASIALCEALAFYNWAQLHLWPGLPEGIRVDKSPDDTAPFVDRIFYTPALALAGYLAGHRLLFDSTAARERMLYGALLAATTLNLLIAGGRAGFSRCARGSHSSGTRVVRSSRRRLPPCLSPRCCWAATTAAATSGAGSTWRWMRWCTTRSGPIRRSACASSTR